MNVLFISNLSGNLFAGPNNSVPAQVKAQSKYDSVFWYNLNRVKRPEWCTEGLDCKNFDDYPSGRLDDLPEPFNRPDIAIIEELYCFPFSKMVLDLQRNRIPYVIIPRSSMTEKAQKKKRYKKKLGNILFFNRMIKKAAAIQYLTNQEKSESEVTWKKKNYVIPNGIVVKENSKNSFPTKQINATYIGRFEIYQKGLDLLIEAISLEQEILRKKEFRLDMYGPDQENSLKTMEKLCKEKGIEDIVSFSDAVFGDEKREVLLNSDVFIMSSRFEGHPMGLIEALSYGIPCCATLGTNLSEEIKTYNAGWVAENNVNSIRKMLADVVNEVDTFVEKGARAIEVANLFSWDKIAHDSHKVFCRIINEERTA